MREASAIRLTRESKKTEGARLKRGSRAAVFTARKGGDQSVGLEAGSVLNSQRAGRPMS